MTRSMIFGIASLFAGVVASTAQPVAAQQAPAPIHELTRVVDDIWRFRSNNHYGLLLVTSAGAVVIDPLNAETARWLKGELAQRFGGLKVIRVVYSHHHWDHVSGAAEFGPVPIIARTGTVEALRPPPDPTARAKFLKAFAEVVPPTETYTGSVRRLVVGGHMLELHAIATKHAPDLSFVWFPAEKLLLTVDVIALKQVPYRTMDDYDPADFDAVREKALGSGPIDVGGAI